MPRQPAPNGAAPEWQRPLHDVQFPLVEAYLAHWPAGAVRRPRIGLSRSLYVAPTRAEALADAEAGMRRHAAQAAGRGLRADMSVEELLARSDVHIGAPADVVASLRADRLLAAATDLILQVHPVDPSPDKTLRSFHLIATEVAPALGWRAAPRERSHDLATHIRN
jgi:alkanesulfonate monooxygenase SsuD/methylene tetrahydromethanopterin reductase-like flavin-dependent oxidoreductase (luciferase family)